MHGDCISSVVFIMSFDSADLLGLMGLKLRHACDPLKMCSSTQASALRVTNLTHINFVKYVMFCALGGAMKYGIKLDLVVSGVCMRPPVMPYL